MINTDTNIQHNKTNDTKSKNIKHQTTPTEIIATNNTKTHKTRKQNNKLQHIINGNYYLNLVHWNKGNTLFNNKITQIDQLLNTYQPHILSLCEANIEKITNNTQNSTYYDYPC